MTSVANCDVANKFFFIPSTQSTLCGYILLRQKCGTITILLMWAIGHLELLIVTSTLPPLPFDILSSFALLTIMWLDHPKYDSIFIIITCFIIGSKLSSFYDSFVKVHLLFRKTFSLILDTINDASRFHPSFTIIYILVIV